MKGSMMFTTMILISFGIIIGSLVAGSIVYLLLKSRMAIRENVFQVNAAVADTNLQSRIREVESLNFNLQEIQQRMSKAEVNLQKALLSEASLKTSLTEQKNQNKEKLALLDEAKERMNTEFKNIANEIFESKQQLFKAESKEQLGNLLSPLSDRIKEFEKRVETSYNEESKER